jgi:hypothetical protein
MMMTSRLSRWHPTVGLVAANEFLFKRVPCVSVSPLWCARKTSSAPLRKRLTPIPLAPKVRKNLN